MDPNKKREWHCMRAQTKREHVAAAILEHLPEVETFCPKVSQIRKTRNGKRRFIEAMFPGYFFAKFCHRDQYRRIIHSQGIRGMVQLGERRAVPNHVIENIREGLADGIIETPDLSVVPGAEIEIITGSLSGLNGSVLAQLPSANRLQILLEFLGREITVTLSLDDVLLRNDN